MNGGFFTKLLWPSAGGHTSIVLPDYRAGKDEDVIDLQIKSLMYMFRRCDIANAQHFAKDFNKEQRKNNGITTIGKKSCIDLKSKANNILPSDHEELVKEKIAISKSMGISDIEREKLDMMYNKARFEKVLALLDEHRILIDWAKNKFRSMCILSDFPKEMSSLPSFNMSNFIFIVLSSDASKEEYIEKLTTSPIYVEHWNHISLDMRKKIVEKAFTLAKKGNPDKVLNKDDRAFVIRYYLNKVATEVQVERLFRGTLKQLLNQPPVPLNELNRSDHSQQHSTRSRSMSPVRNRFDPDLKTRSRVARSDIFQESRRLQHSSSTLEKQLSVAGNDEDRSSNKLKAVPSTATMATVSITYRSKSRSPSPCAKPSMPSLSSPSSTRLSKKTSQKSLNIFNAMPDLTPTKENGLVHVPADQKRLSPSPERDKNNNKLLLDTKKKEVLLQARAAVKDKLVREKYLLEISV